MVKAVASRGAQRVGSEPARITKFIARQPIFDRNQRVFGFELLFRPGKLNSPGEFDPDEATRHVIADVMLLHGWEKLTDHRKAFINFTAEALAGDYVATLPKDQVVIEILETVEPAREVLANCLRLKEAGYCLALDDVQACSRVEDFLDLADIVKVDFRASTPEERRLLIVRFAPRGIALLAEKVETYEEFQLAKKAGFHLFQGYFFSKPQMISSRDLPTFQANYLHILQAIHRPELNRKEVERILKTETSLCYKLLRYLNSPFFGFRTTISSIGHALTLLGEDQFRRWASLLAVTSMAAGKPEELVVTSLTRAAWCESLADEFAMTGREGDLFLLGLFSLIDAMLDQPLSELLEHLPLSEEIRLGLLLRDSPFADVLRVVEAYEGGDWEELAHLTTSLGIHETKIPETYLNALEWARGIFELAPV